MLLLGVMENVDSILQRARSLPIADRLRIAQALFEDARSEQQTDEADAGRRGLAAWTESTREQDWSACYPPTLQEKKAG